MVSFFQLVSNSYLVLICNLFSELAKCLVFLNGVISSQANLADSFLADLDDLSDNEAYPVS
jgi:hypothetical protein